MNGIHYTPTLVEEELRALIDNKREYIIRQGADSTAAKFMQREVILLERVLRELQLRSDMFMSAMATAIAEKILLVRKHPHADRFVGILVYYETVPRCSWNDDNLNMVACVSNVAGWPFGEGSMVDLENGTLLARDPATASYTLGGRFVTIPIDNEFPHHE